MSQRFLTREFKGERPAGWLVEWLNSKPDTGAKTEAQQRIFSLLDNFLELIALTQASDRSTLRHQGKNAEEEGARQDRINELINFGGELDRKLERYYTRPLIFNYFDGTAKLEINPTPEENKAVETAEEWWAVERILELASDGYLNKLRKCQCCGKWIFVKFPNGDRAQRFCGDGSRCAKKWRESPEYLEQQAEYMRKYRKDEKERNNRAKRTVRRKSR
jgi:hypothetical protein